MLLIVHQCFLMISRKIIVRKTTLQTTNNFFSLGTQPLRSRIGQLVSFKNYKHVNIVQKGLYSYNGRSMYNVKNMTEHKREFYIMPLMLRDWLENSREY